MISIQLRVLLVDLSSLRRIQLSVDNDSKTIPLTAHTVLKVYKIPNRFRLAILTKLPNSILSVLSRLIQKYIFFYCISKMEEHRIVPDVISVVPQGIAKVTFAENVTVDLGNELKPIQVRDIPGVTWNADAETFYTLCLIDPGDCDIFTIHN